MGERVIIRLSKHIRQPQYFEKLVKNPIKKVIARLYVFRPRIRHAKRFQCLRNFINCSTHCTMPSLRFSFREQIILLIATSVSEQHILHTQVILNFAFFPHEPIRSEVIDRTV